MRLRWLDLRRLPIRIRLTIAFGGVIAMVLAAGGIVLATEFERDLDDVIDEDIAARVADTAAVVSEAPTPRQGLIRGAERLSQVYAADGRLLASSAAVTPARLMTVAEVEDVREGDVPIERREIREGDARLSATLTRTRSGRPVVVAVGEALERRDAALARLRELILIVGPLAFLLAIYAGYQVSGAALRPVERMRRRAEQITDRDTAERLPVSETHDEIEALGHTLNELLARLDAALRRERRLLSDASHELRTPLSILRAEVQLALRKGRDADELRAALESVGQETERLSRLADDLLVLARADQGRLPIRSEPLVAADLLDEAERRAATAAGAAGRSVTADLDSNADLVVLADPDRTAQALDNLVANALAYGRGEVRLSAREAGGRIELHVTDRGEGFPQELLGRAFERFSRGDPARSGEGTGLGLAIVAAIARAQGGEFGARNHDGGGADVWISLPVE